MQQPPIIPCSSSISELLSLPSFAGGLIDKITVVYFHKSVIIFFVSLSDYVNFQSWGGQSGHRLEVMPQSKFSGVSGCSDAAVSQGSVCGTPTPDDIVIGNTPKTCMIPDLFFPMKPCYLLLLLYKHVF